MTMIKKDREMTDNESGRDYRLDSRTQGAGENECQENRRPGLVLGKTLVITTLLCLLPMVFGLAVYNRLPEQVPSQFDFRGNVKGTMARAQMVFLLPIVMAFLNVLVHFMMETDPRRRGYPAAMKLMMNWLVPVLVCVMQPISLLNGMGVKVPISFIVTEMMGFLFVICGNYLPKCRQNFSMGIKTPWTLSSEENWNRTHHLAGYLWMVCGVCLMINGIWRGSDYIAFGGIVLAIAIPLLYSYQLYRKGI